MGARQPGAGDVAPRVLIRVPPLPASSGHELNPVSRCVQDSIAGPGKAGTRHQCVEAARTALQADTSVIVDRCNPNPKQREDFCRLAGELGVQVGPAARQGRACAGRRNVPCSLDSALGGPAALPSAPPPPTTGALRGPGPPPQDLRGARAPSHGARGGLSGR